MGLEPGRELDALIATQVLKWTPFKKLMVISGQQSYVNRWLDADKMEQPDDVLPYSTDIVAAWLVLEGLLPKGFLVLVTPQFAETKYTIIKDVVLDPLSWAPSLAQALTLAALKVVGYVRAQEPLPANTPGPVIPGTLNDPPHGGRI